jgi:hypothetical protein
VITMPLRNTIGRPGAKSSGRVPVSVILHPPR